MDAYRPQSIFRQKAQKATPDRYSRSRINRPYSSSSWPPTGTMEKIATGSPST